MEGGPKPYAGGVPSDEPTGELAELLAPPPRDRRQAGGRGVRGPEAEERPEGRPDGGDGGLRLTHEEVRRLFDAELLFWLTGTRGGGRGGHLRVGLEDGGRPEER